MYRIREMCVSQFLIYYEKYTSGNSAGRGKFLDECAAVASVTQNDCT